MKRFQVEGETEVVRTRKEFPAVDETSDETSDAPAGVVSYSEGREFHDAHQGVTCYVQTCSPRKAAPEPLTRVRGFRILRELCGDGCGCRRQCQYRPGLGNGELSPMKGTGGEGSVPPGRVPRKGPRRVLKETYPGRSGQGERVW